MIPETREAKLTWEIAMLVEVPYLKIWPLVKAAFDAGIKEECEACGDEAKRFAEDNADMPDAVWAAKRIEERIRARSQKSE